MAQSSLAKKSNKVLSWSEALSAYINDMGVGNDGIGLFAIQLKFNVDDIKNVASEILTGGGDDKKCDLLLIQPDRKLAVIAQCYMSSKPRVAAPSNKASDLNTALAWLVTSPLDALPEGLKGRAAEFRSSVELGDVEQLHIWYVHNVPESENVRKELRTVAHNARIALKALAPKIHPSIFEEEIGAGTLARMYDLAERAIVVTDRIEFPIPSFFEVSGKNWNSVVTTISGAKLYELYKKYDVDLFSANLRDYLGSRASDSNINNGIKLSAQENAGDFWVYNNGITALTLNYEVPQNSRKRKKIVLTGMSIVNGAQTTGSIGSLSSKPSPNLQIPIRFVKTNESSVIEQIVRFNNSQNKVTASDFRSTDSIQTRLRQEFNDVPDAEYDGGRRGGAIDVMRRRKDLLPSYTVGQALASFHGDPVVAYDKKSEIWTSDATYLRYFNDKTTARHIVFAYSILEAISKKRIELIGKKKKGEFALTEQEEKQLKFLEKRGASYLVSAALSSAIEVILGRAVTNKFEIRFKENVSPSEAAKKWEEILDIFLALSQQLEDSFTRNRIANEKLRETISKFTGVISSLAPSYKPIFAAFSKLVETSKI